MFFRNVSCLGLILLSATSVVAQPSTSDSLTPQQLEVIWKDLIRHDDEGTQKARAAIRSMIASPPATLVFLIERLKPAPVADAKQIDKCIAELDSSDFQTRDKATKALEAFGVLAVPAMEKKLEQKPSLEVRQRVESLLQQIDTQPMTAEELRSLRAMDALEAIGTPEARAILDNLAKGGAGAMTTEHAKKALQRLGNR
jgi:hypothetical protein